MKKKINAKKKNKMKASQLPKNVNTTIRLNERVRDELKRKGISLQEVVDNFIDKEIKIDLTKAINSEDK